MNVLRIIKINVLALIALPLLVLATAVKLLAKALEKTVLIIATIFVLLAIALLLEIGNEPQSILMGILTLIVVLIFFGLIILLLVWILTMISAVIMGFVALIIGVVNALYELVYAGYAGIYHICYEDYCALEMSTGAKRGSCFLFTLLRVFNKVIIFFATNAFKLLLVFTLVGIGWCLFQANTYIQELFGMGVIEYLKLFPVYEMIKGVILYVAAMVAFAIVMISLGIEWSEWGTEMSLKTSDYERYVREIRDGYSEVGTTNVPAGAGMDARRLERYNHYIDILNYHIRGMDTFLQDLMPIAEKSEDHILRGNCGQYITDFYEIVEEINKGGETVDAEVLEGLIPQIDRIEDLRKKVEQQVQRMKENQAKMESKAVTGMNFFSGCDTPEKLEKRYKALCKTYHPDSDAGDEDTFKRMKDEYEARRASM